MLPSEQQAYVGLKSLEPRHLHRRREGVFLVLSGLFLGTLAMINILGLTRFVDLSFPIPGTGWRLPMVLPVGVLPYPITFLCTDFVSELYGRKRANQLVWMGLVINLWVVAVLLLGGALPGVPQALGPGGAGTPDVFFQIQRLAFGSVTASMVAYLLAQFVDVQLFHLLKAWTGGRHLWLRNNGSTLVSQLVDSTVVVGVTFLVGALPLTADRSLQVQLVHYVFASYAFKAITALVDTLPFAVGVRALRRYLRLPKPF